MESCRLFCLLYKRNFRIFLPDPEQLSETIRVHRNNGSQQDPSGYTYHVFLPLQSDDPYLSWFQTADQWHNNLQYHSPGQQEGIYKQETATEYLHPALSDNPVY